jgi:hypothetical protein
LAYLNTASAVPMGPSAAGNHRPLEVLRETRVLWMPSPAGSRSTGLQKISKE